MGNITTVVILNDYAHEIKTSSTLQEQLYYMLASGKTGVVIPGFSIVESHHNDFDVLVKVGDGRGQVVKEGNDKILERVADQLKDIGSDDLTKAEKNILRILEEGK